MVPDQLCIHHSKAHIRTLVTEATLMKTERPVWHLSRKSDDVCVLTGNLRRVALAAGEEVEVEHATNDVVLERRARTLSVVDLDVHTVGVSEEHAMCASRTVLEVDRVVPVQVRALRDAIRVARPKGARVVVPRETERVCVLA